MVGTTISHYRILSVLGRGGMGVVYKAEDKRLGRTVALKFLPDELAGDPVTVERFQREARAVSALNHPNICTLHDIDVWEGHHFLVMEYLVGETLRDRIHKGPANIDELLDLSIQIVDALDTAHAGRIMHRDIKPANIFVTTRGQIKVMDFGLAKATVTESTGEAVNASVAPTVAADMVTAHGQTLGTIAYMSPEQARGETLDHRTDLFSFGVVLYEMATGKSPFQSTTTALTFVSILHNAPIPPSRLRPGTPPELERIINKCLEKDPDMRYQTAAEIRGDLKRMRRDSQPGGVSLSTLDHTIPADLQPTQEIASLPEQGSRVGLAAVQDPSRSPKRRLFTMIAAVIAALLIATGALYFALRERSLDSLAVLPFVNVNGDPSSEYLSDGITESIVNNMSQLRRLSVRSFSSVVRYKKPDVNPQSAGRDLNVQAVLTGRLARRADEFAINVELIDVGNNRQIWGSQYRVKVADLLATEEQISREISEKLRLKLTGEEQNRLVRASTVNTEAYQLYLQGRYHWNKRTLEDLQQSIDLFEQAIQKDPRYALAYAGQADAYALLAEFNVLPSREVMPKVKSAASKALELDASLAEAHTSLASAKFHDWDWIGAEAEFQRAIELNPNYATAHSSYGELLMALGRLDAASSELSRARDLDPVSPAISLGLANRLYYAGQYAAAVEQGNRTLALDSQFLAAQVLLGRAFEQQGMHRDAILTLQKALALSGDDSNELAALGHAYASAHQSADARKILDQLIERSRQTYVQPVWLAVIYVELGDKDQAFAWLQKAYQDRSSWLVYLKVDPFFDNVRSDRRFIDLAGRVGVSPSR